MVEYYGDCECIDYEWYDVECCDECEVLVGCEECGCDCVDVLLG